MATLTVSSDNNNGVVVLKGKMSWIQQRAVAYRNKGFNVLITWEQKWERLDNKKIMKHG